MRVNLATVSETVKGREVGSSRRVAENSLGGAWQRDWLYSESVDPG